MRKNTGREAERAKTVRGRELRPGERESGEKRTQEDMLTRPSAALNIGQSGSDGHFLQWVALKVTLSGSA